jgi:pimeloyl-ACP methyl ester carboxylesterase
VLATVNGIQVHYDQHGSGTPVLALHGVGVDHREIMGALEPLFAGRPGYRRVYPDLPGMGRTPAPETIDSTDAVLDTRSGWSTRSSARRRSWWSASPTAATWPGRSPTGGRARSPGWR